MMRLSCLLACAALAACAPPPGPSPGPAFDPAADTRQWFYAHEGGGANLAYGTPQSDDVVLSMSCRERSRRVTVQQGALGPREGLFIASGGRRATLQGATEEDQLNGGRYMQAHVDAAHPVLAAFRASGSLRTREGGRGVELTATAAERASIDQFFRVCGA